MISGRLGRLHLGDLMQWLQMGSLSGRLTLTGAGGDRRLDFLEGRVVFASSTRPDERLGMWLAREGTESVQNLRRCLAQSLVDRRLFTDVLLEADLIDPAELRASVTHLAETLVRRALAVAQARFQFDPSYPVLDLLALNLDLDPNALLMEAARQRDELCEPESIDVEPAIPVSGESFERLIWELLREGVSTHHPIDGLELEEIHAQLRRLVSTLGQWLGASPGLVPIPAENGSMASGLTGRAHATWNALVLASSVVADVTRETPSMGALEELELELHLSTMMAANESWCRPYSSRLDSLTRSVVDAWSRAAAAAAPFFGVQPDTAVVGVHLIVVPTDLVLWMLTTVPVSHQGVRHGLLRSLPRRLGAGLAQLVNFPTPLAELLTAPRATALAACLQIGREVIPSAPVWLDTLPGGAESLSAAASGATIEAALAAAQAALPGASC